MPTRNLRQGRVRIVSGDLPVRLETTAAFTEGDLTWTRTKNVIQVKDRGGLSHLRRGDEEPVTFSFSAKFTDKTLRELLLDFVWRGQTQLLIGLTAQAVNTPTVSYAYEQGTLQPASGEAITTKLGNGVTPSSDGEFSENVGALDEEGNLTEVRPGGLSVQPGAADTDFSVTYDAVGLSTRDAKAEPLPRCPADAKTFLLLLEKRRPENLDIVDEVYEMNHAYIETCEQAEGDEFDILTFNGVSYLKRVSINKILPGGPDVIAVELSDDIVVVDNIVVEIL